MLKIRITNEPDWQAQLQAALRQAENAPRTEIRFAPGDYYMTEGVALDDCAANIAFVGEPGAALIGGRPLTHWSPADAAALERFAPEVRPHIVMCDLAAEGIAAVSGFSSRGFDRAVQPGHSQLFAGDRALTLAQYPRGNAFTHISRVARDTVNEWNDHTGALEDGFYCDDRRLAQWQPDDDIWALGYWDYDWANTVERMASRDPDGRIRMAPPYGQYAYRKDQRIRFYHVLEEVTQPGDYYIDARTRRAYLYPISDAQPENISVSLLRAPMFALSGCRNITFRGLAFSRTCGEVISAEFCENLRVDGCTMAQIGSAAIDIHEGRGIAVENCTIHDCGDDGVLLFGGNRCTLEPLDAKINNNHIYQIAQWSKCYHPAIHMIGVGMEARHNLIHDCPHTAIMFWGNDMKVCDNEIYRVVLETGDAGAIYTGRDYTFRGNEVCHNFIHHLGGVGMGTMGIYNDDTVSGTVMRNNYFESLTRGVMLGGGRDFVVENNVFVKCDPAISFDSRGATPNPVWGRGMVQNMRPRYYFIERYPHCDNTTDRNNRAKELHRGEYARATDAPYITRYPELAALDRMFRVQEHDARVYIPGQAEVANNVFVPRTAFRYRYDEPTKKMYDHGREVPCTRMLRAYVEDFSRNLLRTIDGRMGDLHLRSNFVGQPDDLVAPEWGDLRVKADSAAQYYGYENAQFETIGLQEERRAQNPPTVRTCIEYTPGSTQLRIGLRSERGGDVRGTLYLNASAELTLEQSALPFALAAGEEQWLTVPVHAADDAAASPDDPVIDVYSDVPGVRPART